MAVISGMAFHEHFNEAMTRAKVDQSAVARHLKITASAVNQWARGQTQPPPKRWPKLSEILNVSEAVIAAWVHDDFVIAPPSEPLQHTETTLGIPSARVALDAPAIPPAQHMARDVPVFGTAQGGDEGAFILNTVDGAIDYVRRPPGIAPRQSVFAIYVEGDSMYPRFKPGELVYVHAERPAAPGSYVVVEVWSDQPGMPPSAFIKKLVRRNASTLELDQYNPPSTITIDLDKVSKIYRVMEWNEVLGV